MIMVDELGGTHDHAAPPTAISPDGIVSQEGFTFDRLGIRVPTIVVSANTERGIESVFNLSEPRQDRWHPSPLPYTPGVDNPGFQPIRPGYEPTAQMAMEQRKQLGREYVSELGEATLGSAAALPGIHPEDVPLNADASHARRWLMGRLTKDGRVDILEST